jgi:hypothetical protein
MPMDTIGMHRQCVVTDIKFDYVSQSTNRFSFIHINKGLLALGNVISALGADQLIRVWRRSDNNRHVNTPLLWLFEA